ncbi:transcriptional regulator [Streptomyces sp. MBT53]|uniref:transcriptional regulator n=1 Tax=Streptomyces sp. MBT53 TaxID=1488384 RepID=UPI00191214DD|nr:transcriptional regulator [Streptomyces sp. MBT53]MBK6012746.1 transcriptional regulator [Streptomyces sp. MBT53]
MTTNPLVARIETGAAPIETLATLALEQHRVIPADRRAFLHLAQRETATPEAADFFAFLAEGEAMAGERLIAFAEACGVDEARLRTYEPLAGCQAYPAYVAWLALNADPTDVVAALTSNFAEWGGYCATIAGALREHYAFTEEACGFFDFFAEPAPELELRATAAIRADKVNESSVTTYSTMLKAYEASFWNTLGATP